MHPRLSTALAPLLLGCAIGCQSSPSPAGGRMPVPFAPPPGYPMSKDVPLDSQLQAAARAQIAQALDSSDPAIRAHAIEAAQNVTGTEYADRIVADLSDVDPMVRYAAGLAVGQLRLRQAADRLLAMVNDPDPAVRVVVRFALHRIGIYQYSHDLELLARDPQARVRGTTAMVLGMIGDPSALSILRRMQTDHAAPVRQEAAIAIWKLGGEQGLRDLIGWTISPYQDDQKVAILGLAAPRNRNVIQHIRAELTAPGPEVDLVAARAMGMLGCDEGYGIAQQNAAARDPRLRVLSAMAFGAIGRSDSQSVLHGLLSDPVPDVRIAAAQAILQLRPHFQDECSR